MLHKLAIAILTTVLSIGLAAPATQHVTAMQVADAMHPRAILRVRSINATNVNVMAAALAEDFDLLEMRDGADLFVMGDDVVAAALRARGYTVEVQQKFASRTQYYGGYRTIAEHYAHLDAVASAHPELVQLVDYGDSWRKVNRRANGHDLRAICITKLRTGDCALDPNSDKPRFFIMAAIHARELTTAEIAWRWIDYLVDGYGVDADVTTLLDSTEMWIVPQTNPDGRSIVEEGGNDPYYHRKNADVVSAPCTLYSPPSNYYGSYHPGVDLNRNGSWMWDPPISASNTKCSAVYRGPSVASEPETYFLETLIRQLFRDERGPVISDTAPLTMTGAFITLHSFANQVILPWNHTTSSKAPNDAGLRALAFRMSHYNGYTTGQSGEVLYSTSGSTDDFAYGELGVPAFTFEIGPGYGDCADFMPPFSCQDGFWNENLGALLYAAKAARAPYVLSHGPAPTMITSTATSNGALVHATFDDNAFGNVGYGRPAAQAVISAELYLDAPPWAGGTPIAMAPIDGAGDSSSEKFEATSPFSPCIPLPTTAWVRAFDADGNAGVFASTWISAPLDGMSPTICSAQIDRLFVVTDTPALLQVVVSNTLPLSITAAEMQIDASDFISNVIAMTPVDGAADSASETFTTTIDSALLAVGAHTATLRALTYTATYTPTREIAFIVLPPGYRNVYVPAVVQ